MPYKTALDMSLYLDKENDYVPWKAATSALAYIGGRLSMTSNYGLYQVNISNCFFRADEHVIALHIDVFS